VGTKLAYRLGTTNPLGLSVMICPVVEAKCIKSPVARLSRSFRTPLFRLDH
jgi:hypothetical protein